MLGKRYLLNAGACSIALLLLSTSAWAQLTGTVYQVDGNMNNATIGESGTIQTTDGTFTTGAQLEDIYFATNPLASGDLATFLATDTHLSPDNVTNNLTSLMSDCTNSVVVANTDNTCYSTEIEITGSANLVNGTTYTFSHDDGVIVDVNGSAVLNSATPTADENSSFTWTGATGSQTISIGYMATNGNPEVLEVTSVAAPEPGSVVTLLSMLGAVAGFAGILKKKLA